MTNPLPEDQPRPLPATVCPLCGGPNDCAPAQCGSFDTPCWCTTVKVDPATRARIPEDQRNRACLCRRCATGQALNEST